jgi:hypothetical protein
MSSWESGNPTQRLRLAYAATNVTDVTWVLVGNVTSSAKICEIYDNGTKAMELGIGSSTANAVAIPMFVMPGGNGRINLNLDGGGTGNNLYIRCAEASTTVNTGQFLMNIFT